MNLTTWKKKYHVPSNKKLEAKTLQYIDGKGWYADSYKALKAKYGVHTEIMIKLIGVTSPRNTVKRNLYLARKTLDYTLLSKEIDFSYGIANKAIKNNVDKVLTGGTPGGIKVNRFIKALLGVKDAVVIDSWMLKVFNINRISPTKNDIQHITTVIKKIADKTNLEPREVQACLWCYAKTELNDTVFKEDNNYSFYLKEA